MSAFNNVIFDQLLQEAKKHDPNAYPPGVGNGLFERFMQLCVDHKLIILNLGDPEMNGIAHDLVDEASGVPAKYYDIRGVK